VRVKFSVCPKLLPVMFTDDPSAPGANSMRKLYFEKEVLVKSRLPEFTSMLYLRL
jgi:hypothetical protein